MTNLETRLDGGTQGFPLSPELRSEVMAAAIAALGDYVCPEMAQHLQAHLAQQGAAGAYDDLAEGMQLAERLTLELQECSGDRQLRLHFSPQPLPELTPQQSPTPAELAAERDRSAHRNFDLNRVERLRGNVGYLELFGFEPPEFLGDALAAAFTLLHHTQALILDLRHNRGGSPASVALLCSYLLPPYPALHLNDLHWRPDGSVRQSWTIPHLSGPRYLHRPVYVLTSGETFSAGEECAYHLQALQRATLVGETTAGAAHPGQGYRLGDHFWLFVPVGRSRSPLTGENWAGTGVVPTVKVPAELALLTAHRRALEGLLDSQPQGSQWRELQRSLVLVDQELNHQRADLITRLKCPAPAVALIAED